MTNAELIKALRKCGKASADRCWNCGYYDREPWCESALANDAADALEADEKRTADLEAQLPKEGEWLRTDAFPHRIYCSVCYKTYVPNDRWQIWVDDDLPKNYCPNCGAKMDRKENADADN